MEARLTRFCAFWYLVRQNDGNTILQLGEFIWEKQRWVDRLVSEASRNSTELPVRVH